MKSVPDSMVDDSVDEAIQRLDSRKLAEALKIDDFDLKERHWKSLYSVGPLAVEQGYTFSWWMRAFKMIVNKAATQMDAEAVFDRQIRLTKDQWDSERIRLRLKTDSNSLHLIRFPTREVISILEEAKHNLPVPQTACVPNVSAAMQQGAYTNS